MACIGRLSSNLVRWRLLWQHREIPDNIPIDESLLIQNLTGEELLEESREALKEAIDLYVWLHKSS